MHNELYGSNFAIVEDFVGYDYFCCSVVCHAGGLLLLVLKCR